MQKAFLIDRYKSADEISGLAGRYSIYYRPVEGGIEVLRILHERRDHDELV